MKLIFPQALWFLSLIPIFVLMYILKQRYEERQFSSLYLWHQVVLDTDATSPFQRLKSSLLFLLQLLILLMCIFALTNPFIWWDNNNYENVVIVIDTSGSMSAQSEKGTKLDEAKEKALNLVNSISSGSKVTLINASRNFKVEVSGSNEKGLLIKKIREIEPTNSAGNIEESLSLVKSICNQYESYRAFYFTDNGMDLKGLNGEVIKLGTKRPNVSLDYIAESINGNRLNILLRATNHGNEKTVAEICLYAEDKLVSASDEELNAGQTKTMYFDNIPSSTKYIYGELTQKDGLDEDNRIYSIVKQADSKRVLLSADKNIFLEKALTTLKDIELFKTSPNEKIKDEFDLYIYDGENKGHLPQKGNMLFINPQNENNFFSVGVEKKGARAIIKTHGITKYMGNSDFVVSKFNEIETPYWSNPLLEVGENTVAFAGEKRGQKIAVIGFDLHNTDFPLTLEFPIFINNLVSYLINRDTMTNVKYNCGEEIEINPLPEAEKLFVKDPRETTTEISSKYPIRPYDKTYLPGVYEINQKVGIKFISKLVAVNFPVEESSYQDIEVKNKAVSANTTNRGGINLLNLLIALAIFVITAEWVVWLRQI